MLATIARQTHGKRGQRGEMRAVDMTYTPSHFYTKTTSKPRNTPSHPEPPRASPSLLSPLRLDPVVNYRGSNKLATKDASEPRGDHQAARQRRYTARRPL